MLKEKCLQENVASMFQSPKAVTAILTQGMLPENIKCVLELQSNHLIARQVNENTIIPEFNTSYTLNI